MMRTHLVYICFNRLHYTKLSLPRLLADPNEVFDLTIWDNGSSDGTRDYLMAMRDPRIKEVVLSETNAGQVAAINKVWSSSSAELLGKVDNDCLLTPGWTATLGQAHADIPELGAVACWHFFEDDFDYSRAKHKIQAFGKHYIFRQAGTCGSGILVKRSMFKRFGPMTGKSTTQLWWKMAMGGAVNGFYYPLVLQEHMDDPKSSYSVLKDEASYQAAKSVTFGISLEGQDTLEDRWKQREEMLAILHDAPYDVRYYVGWRAKVHTFGEKIRRVAPWGKRSKSGARR